MNENVNEIWKLEWRCVLNGKKICELCWMEWVINSIGKFAIIIKWLQGRESKLNETINFLSIPIFRQVMGFKCYTWIVCQQFFIYFSSIPNASFRLSDNKSIFDSIFLFTKFFDDSQLGCPIQSSILWSDANTNNGVGHPSWEHATFTMWKTLIQDAQYIRTSYTGLG